MSAESGAPSTQPAAAPRPRRRWLAFLPLGVFVALAGLFLLQLTSGRDASVVPSALIGEAAPLAPLPPLEDSGLPAFDPATFRGRVTLVNVWASWCAPCRVEHPLLMELAGEGKVEIAGINYKDEPANARRFLGELGNPYDAVGRDASGRVAIDWGVYGVPETFLVGPDGHILWKHVGPLTPEIVESALRPRIEEASAAAR